MWTVCDKYILVLSYSVKQGAAREIDEHTLKDR